MNIDDLPTVSEEQMLFNKLGYEERQFILKQMKLLQPCEKISCEILEEEKKIPEKINDWITGVGRVDDSNIEEYIHKLFEQQTILYFKINSIIDYLKSKGDE